jgi:guanylate cyclase
VAAASRAGVEKIKTIGDCYMAASGAPDARPDHAATLVRLALEMAALVASRDFAGHTLQLRIGVHTGPVVAGVIGRKRQAYDMWGDTVNTASRMESSGVPGRVHVSGATRARPDESFDVEGRGLVELKGKGKVETYLVRGWEARSAIVESPLAS